MLLLPNLFRKDLAEIAKADRDADPEAIAAFVAELTEAGLYAEATEDEIEKLDELI